MWKPVTICSFLLVITTSAWGSETLANEGKNGLYTRSIDRVLRLDEEEIDLATAALLLSQQAGAEINVQRYRGQIDEMAYTILGRLGKNWPRGRRISSAAGQAAIKQMNKYLFEELGFKAVETADDSQDLFLHSVLERKKGYCLSLSFLYLSIGERLGLPLYGVVVPGHFFVRYDDGKVRFNIETTGGGGSPPDDYYTEKFKVPYGRQSIYMENLSKLQSLGCFFNNLGNFYQETGNMDAALVQLQMAVQITPSVGMAHTNLGNVYLAKGLVDKAISEYRLALYIDPEDAKTRNNLGNAYFQKGWTSEAISEYKTSLRSDPNSIDAYKNLAKAYASQEMFNRAILELKRAMAMAAESEQKILWVHLGDVYRQMGNYKAAIFQYKQALREDDDLTEARYGLAITYHKMEWIDEALEELKKILSVRADSAIEREYRFGAMQTLGNIYMQKEMYDAAIEEYQKAVSLKSWAEGELEELALVHYNIAVAWSKKEDYEKAVSSYLSAVEIKPDLAEGHNGLGICYYYLKKYDLAWEHIKKAEALGFEVQKELYEAVRKKVR